MLFEYSVCILADNWILAVFALEKGHCNDGGYWGPEHKILGEDKKMSLSDRETTHFEVTTSSQIKSRSQEVRYGFGNVHRTSRICLE